MTTQWIRGRAACALHTVVVAAALSANTQAQVLVDDFDDDEADPVIWMPFQEGTGSSLQQADGRLRFVHRADARDGSNGFFMVGYDSVCKLRGDYDIRVDYYLEAWPLASGIRVGLNTEVMATERASLGSPADFPDEPLREVYTTDQGDGEFNFIETNDLAGTLRQVRSGNMVTGYYFHPNNDDWVVINTRPAHEDDVIFRLASWSHDYAFTNRAVQGAFDNFRIVAGELVGDTEVETCLPVQPPEAVIEPMGPLVVNEGAEVMLDGSMSKGVVSYRWILESELPGPDLIDDPTAAVATFMAPYTDEDLELTFVLDVDGDGDGEMSEATVVVTVVSVNAAPTADAGEPGTIKRGATATLDGRGSADPEGSDLSYRWTQLGGAEVTLSDDTAAIATFVAPVGDLPQDPLVFELVVTDAPGESSEPDLVQVDVVTNSAPVAVVDGPFDIDEPDVVVLNVDELVDVVLDGTASSDADGGDTLAFSWEQIGGATLTLDNDAASTASFQAPEVDGEGETLRFRLTVSDDDPVESLSSAAEVKVNVRDSDTAFDCALATAQPNTLWPHDGTETRVRIRGVFNRLTPRADRRLEIHRITQDEPVAGFGRGRQRRSEPDAQILPRRRLDVATVLAERLGRRDGGDGRVYRIFFSASDGTAAQPCEGSVDVLVPLRQNQSNVEDADSRGPMDEGYNSLGEEAE